jgi:O-methyltransferase
MSTAASIYYRQSSFQRAMRKLLPFAAVALPERLFHRLFSLAFGFYRSLIRFFYLRFVLYGALTGDRLRVHKTLLVFRVMPRSLVGWRGLEATYDVVLNVLSQRIKGAIVECGVARGGSAALMGMMTEGALDRALWLFDSYEGLPEPTAADFSGGVSGRHLQPLTKGSCLGTYEGVRELLFARLHLSSDRVSMVKGWFQDTLKNHAQSIGRVSLLRIDADWYDSVRCCLEALYDLVVPGGFVIIDDYGSCFGAQKALDEFLAARRTSVVLIPDGRGGVHFQKSSVPLIGS